MAFEQSFKEKFNAVEALQDRVIVKRLETLQRESGIILPGQINEKPMRGIVVCAGPGKPLDDGTNRAMPIKAGDYVLFSKYSGNDFVFNGEELLVMREEDIMARFSVAKDEGAAS